MSATVHVLTTYDVLGNVPADVLPGILTLRDLIQSTTGKTAGKEEVTCFENAAKG